MRQDNSHVRERERVKTVNANGFDQGIARLPVLIFLLIELRRQSVAEVAECRLQPAHFYGSRIVAIVLAEGVHHVGMRSAYILDGGGGQGVSATVMLHLREEQHRQRNRYGHQLPRRNVFVLDHVGLTSCADGTCLSQLNYRELFLLHS